MGAAAKRAPVTRERILRAALDIVDREGLSAITMQRVGEEVGVEAMSLYNHVPSKAAILDGLFEVVLEELPKAKKSAPKPRAYETGPPAERSAPAAPSTGRGGGTDQIPGGVEHRPGSE